MSFSEMMKELQKREEGRIIFCNAGEFYVAIGKDAVLLNKILVLKRFVPSVKGKNVSVKYVLVKLVII